MSDRREDILSRLQAVLAVTGIVGVHRNREFGEVSEVPSVYIYDGDETADLVPPGSRGPTLVTMAPEIVVDAMATSEGIGPALNALRKSIVSAVMSDATLRTLVTSNGSITYRGCSTQLSRAKSRGGEIALAIEFTYPFTPGA